MAALSACASPRVTECGATGVLCPAGTHCAAAQGICLPDTNTCGDAHKDPGEICDDGNTVDGDGCSHDCLSDESCGNGTKDEAAGEVCDDSNNIDGDGCSADCTSDESCGNGITDRAVGEVCDDTNHVGGDGCSADCHSDERCGNSITDRSVGEVCDPPTPGKCGPDCKSLLQCGNEIIDDGEECDNGSDNGDDKDCRSDCVVNRCGDGFPNTLGARNHEDCDGATPVVANDRHAVPTQTAGCNIDCTAPRCGDGIVNDAFTPPGAAGPEQCDNLGANNDNADCTAHCQLSACGDNLKNTAGPLRAEGCDDGNRNDNDDCTNLCVAKRCGDGILDQTGPDAEQCDNGDDPSNPNRNNDSGACLSNCRIATCGDGKTRQGIEECDAGPGGDANCSPLCRNRTCGNHIIDPGEECDDGATDDRGDCRHDCVINRCGDGFVNELGSNIEACDAAPPAALRSTNVTPTETASCNLNCTRAVCGDGILNTHLDEECDNGTDVNNPNRNNDEGDCRTDCVVNRCGDGHPNNSSGPNHEQCDKAPVRVNGDRTVTPTDTNTCNSNCTTARCGDGVVNTAFKPTGTTFEQCENDVVASGAPVGNDGCSSTCQLENCGNGTVDPGEQCDLGSSNSNTGACTLACRNATCGDGFTQVPEQCDDGASNSNTGACTLACRRPVCGDGIVNQPPAHPLETCDSGNTADCGSCNSSCSAVHSAQGTGLLIVNSTALISSGRDTFTLSDGVISRTFTFDRSDDPAPAPSPPTVSYDADDPVEAVAAKIVTAISSSPLHITARQFDPPFRQIVLLVNKRATQTDGSLTASAANNGFQVTDITGGVGGNCPANTGCASDDDCIPSLVCRAIGSPATFKCTTP
jgi:cysteine-rich repeat protein